MAFAASIEGINRIVLLNILKIGGFWVWASLPRDDQKVHPSQHHRPAGKAMGDAGPGETAEQEPESNGQRSVTQQPAQQTFGQIFQHRLRSRPREWLSNMIKAAGETINSSPR
ncbi:MAG: hypothetical protein BZY88_18535 [SAR202 cluster bacterium Io17-Chloro-G9]|nr:MAG: hypothetical protein BZY88_18535 [SAR202 cluster bacterium Io17-Chloro-G9]